MKYYAVSGMIKEYRKKESGMMECHLYHSTFFLPVEEDHDTTDISQSHRTTHLVI